MKNTDVTVSTLFNTVPIIYIAETRRIIQTGKEDIWNFLFLDAMSGMQKF